jgi:surface antigen Omp85-like protein
MVAFMFALALLLTPELVAQSLEAPSSSRADQIQSQRLNKAANLRVEERGKYEEFVFRAERVVRRLPIQIGVGGLGPGAGFAVGSSAEWNSSTDRIQAKAWGTVSVNRFYHAGGGVYLPTPLNNLTLSIEGSHSDAPQLEYYGPGPDSLLRDRSNYRREDTLFNFRLASDGRRLGGACHLGELLLNVGPGKNDSIPSTETLFGPGEAPGVDVQSNFLIAGCSARFDTTDFPGDPHVGTFAEVIYDRYHAQSDDRFSFHRLSGVAEQYVPFLNKKRVVVLRAQTDISLHSADQVVPFYLQPTLGSDTELRGFRRFRFYDENAIALTGEYRWEIHTGFDMALFSDFGKVFHPAGEISLSGMESSFGFGFRFKNKRNMVARLDTGFSREGVQVWLKFGKLF